MNEKELEALSRVLYYLDGNDLINTIEYDSIVLRDWLNYQIDMAAETRVSNDAKRAAAHTHAKERS